MTKLLHVADTHCGYRQYGRYERELDFYNMLDQVLAISIEEKVKAVIIAGDIFDSLKPCSEAVEAVQAWVTKTKLNGIDVLGIAGNHDACNDEWTNVCGITSVDGNPVTIQDLQAGPLVIRGKNWRRPSVFMEELKLERDEGVKADIYVMHQAVAGLTPFGSDDIQLDEIASVFSDMGVKYAALGDIHTYTETVVSGVRFCYPGSPERCSVDDTGMKSVHILEFGKNTFTTRPVEVNPRKFMRIVVDSESVIDGVMANLSQFGSKPVVVLTYEPRFREYAQRIEGVLKSEDIIYRMYPMTDVESGISVELTVNEYERKSTPALLTAAIDVYFEDDSKQRKLIQDLILSKDPDGLLKNYAKKELG